MPVGGCICLSAGAHVCACMGVSRFACVHVQACTCIRLYTHTCICVCVVHLCMCIYAVYICLYYACLYLFIYWASLISQSVKHLPAVQGTRVRSLGREDPLEKEMATHSINLAWSIPWTEEPGRLQSTGLQELDTT